MTCFSSKDEPGGWRDPACWGLIVSMGEALREEIAALVAGSEEVEAEIRFLLAVLERQ